MAPSTRRGVVQSVAGDSGPGEAAVKEPQLVSHDVRPVPKWHVEKHRGDIYGLESRRAVTKWIRAVRLWESELDKIFPAKVSSTTFPNVFESSATAQEIARTYVEVASLVDRTQYPDVDPHLTFNDVLEFDLSQTIEAVKLLVNLENTTVGNQQSSQLEDQLRLLDNVSMRVSNKKAEHQQLNLFAVAQYIGDFKEVCQQYDLENKIPKKKLFGNMDRGFVEDRKKALQVLLLFTK